MLFSDILRKVLLTESITINDIENVIDNRKRVIINYKSEGKDLHTGKRVIEVYVYGKTSQGNDALRAFQPFGDTTSKVPSWKLFRIDRITSWKETNQTFNHPADFYYKNLGKFNETGDKSLTEIYKIIQFPGSEKIAKNIVTNNVSGPKTKLSAPEIFKTDTENNMERLKQQVMNPIKISDLKKNDAFKGANDDISTNNGPKTKSDIINNNSDNIYKTDSEKNINQHFSGINNQLKKPIYLSDLKKNNIISQDDINNFRNKIGNTDEPIKVSDLEKRISDMNKEPETNNNNQEDLENQPQWKKDAYNSVAGLRNQLNNNPRKIDLSKIPRK